MFEGDRLEPVDTDMDFVTVVPARHVQVLAARSPCADEYGIEVLVEQRVHALDTMPHFQVCPHVEDVTDLLIKDARWQSKLRNIRAHQTAGFVESLENRYVIAERQQIVGHGQRRTAGADQRNLFTVLALGRLRQTIRNVVTMVGSDPFETANGHRPVFDAAAATRRLAGPVTDAPEDAGKYVGIAVFDVGVAEATLGDQPNVQGNIGVCRTSPLTIHDLVEVIRVGGISRLHSRVFLAIDSRPTPYPILYRALA